MFDSRYLDAILLTALAGLSTTIGSFIGIFYKSPGPRYMAFTLGFSAGVMVLVSFVELLGAGIQSVGFAGAMTAFFAGIFAMFAIDLLLPHFYILEGPADTGGDGRLVKVSVMAALGIAIHNFPEGMATLAAALKDFDMGIAMAMAIAIHNIPEGIAVAAPLYAATRSARIAFKWSFLSGLTEPVGAMVALLVLMPFLNDAVIGWMLCVVAGFMVFISFDELLPASHSYGMEHVSISGITAGMIVMAISLALLA